MNAKQTMFSSVLAAAFALAAALLPGAAAAAGLRVVATLPDLGWLVQQVGGDEVRVDVLVKGPQDPHFVEPRPSFIRTLHGADLLVANGMQLEIGWLPALLRTARNPRIQPGGAGYLDASRVIVPLDVPTGRVDRSMGDVHPMGNPHYLTDPINGLRVAASLREKLSELRPASAADFAERERALSERVAVALVGPEVVGRHGADAVVAAVAAGQPDSLAGAGADARLGGWLGALQTHRGAKAVEDHLLWVYFARRFGLDLVGVLEPRPGIAPTTRHLTDVVALMQAQHVGLVLSSPYMDRRHARWVAEKAGARVVDMAHQSGSRPGVDGYLDVFDWNVRQLLEAMEAE